MFNSARKSPSAVKTDYQTYLLILVRNFHTSNDHWLTRFFERSHSMDVESVSNANAQGCNIIGRVQNIVCCGSGTISSGCLQLCTAFTIRYGSSHKALNGKCKKGNQHWGLEDLHSWFWQLSSVRVRVDVLQSLLINTEEYVLMKKEGFSIRKSRHETSVQVHPSIFAGLHNGQSLASCCCSIDSQCSNVPSGTKFVVHYCGVLL